MNSYYGRSNRCQVMFMVEVEPCQSVSLGRQWIDGSTITTILSLMGKKLFLPTISYNPSTVVKVLEAFSFSGSYTTIVYFVQAKLSKHKLLPLMLPNDNLMSQLICFFDPQSRQQDLEGKKASAASLSPEVPGCALARDR